MSAFWWRKTATVVCSLVLTVGTRSALATALGVKASGPKTFYIDPRAGANQVVINSESTLEDFTSVINTVSGQFALDSKNLEGISGKFTVRVADIHTGLDLRDKDLQGPDWIDAPKYPLITITVTGGKNVQVKSANSSSMDLIATCSMHGVTVDMPITATLIYLDESAMTRQRAQGDLISVRANLSFKLSAFKISGPTSSERAIGLKVADVQPVRVSVFASSVQPPPSLEGSAGLAPQGQTGSAPGGPTTRPAAPNTPALPLPPRPSGQ
jgi:polyisoprenoid-binding protein YceI